MRFSKVKLSKDDEVELTHADVHTHSRNDIETTGVNPLPSFRDAVRAFLPLFLRVVPQLEEVKDNLRVSTLTLGEKDGDRSLQISASLAIDACNGAAISMTTPRITTPPEGATDDQIHLTRAELRLIETLEAEAEKYFNGETAQGEMFASSDNTKAFDENAAAAEVKSTRTPGKDRSTRKAADATNGQHPGEVMNPDKTEAPMNDDQLRQVLGTVERDVSVDAIAQWTATERQKAQAWAVARQKEILGQLTNAKMPTEPPHVIAAANPRIGAEEWTSPIPPPRAEKVQPVTHVTH